MTTPRSLHPRELKLAIRDTHFLYLPVLYAFSKEVNFFGLLPSDSKVSLVRVTPYQDDEVYERVMDNATEENRKIIFGLCDPTEVFTEGPKGATKPCVLAAVVTNTGFWAVDRAACDAKVLADLSVYENILSFKRGTTSYNIAKTICRTTGKPDSCIKEVDNPLTELPRTAVGSTVALSPELLDIVSMLPRGFRIELTLSRTVEYVNVLSTILISNQEAILSHGDVIRPVLRAIHRALEMTRNADPKIVEFAQSRFDKGEDLIKVALTKAIEGDLFPASLMVREADWQRALQARIDPVGDENKAETQRRALQYFEQYCTPFMNWASEAIDAEKEFAVALQAQGRIVHEPDGSARMVQNMKRVFQALTLFAWAPFVVKFAASREMVRLVLVCWAIVPSAALYFGKNEILRGRKWVHPAVFVLFLLLLCVAEWLPATEATQFAGPITEGVLVLVIGYLAGKGGTENVERY